MIAIPKPQPTDQLPAEPPLTGRLRFAMAWCRFRAALRRLRLLAEGWLLSKLLGLMVKIQRPVAYRLLAIWESLHGGDVARDRLIGSLEDAVHAGDESEVANG